MVYVINEFAGHKTQLTNRNCSIHFPELPETELVILSGVGTNYFIGIFLVYVSMLGNSFPVTVNN